jgi:hypothetical protein
MYICMLCTEMYVDNAANTVHELMQLFLRNMVKMVCILNSQSLDVPE